MITLSRLRPGHGSLDESARPILAFRLVVALRCRLDSPRFGSRIGPWAERGYRHWLLLGLEIAGLDVAKPVIGPRSRKICPLLRQERSAGRGRLDGTVRPTTAICAHRGPDDIDLYPVGRRRIVLSSLVCPPPVDIGPRDASAISPDGGARVASHGYVVVTFPRQTRTGPRKASSLWPCRTGRAARL